MKKESKEQSFFSFMDEEVDRLKKRGQAGTAQNYLSAKKSFRKFVGRDRFSFEKVTEGVVTAYEKWLIKRGISRNTSSFYMRQLRAVYHKGRNVNKGGTADPFVQVYTGIDKTKKRAVDETVLSRLIELDLSAYPSLNFARDLFMLSFYMRGIAFVDMAYLKKENVKRGCIRYYRHKTKILMEVRLEKCISEIIDRYAGKSRLDYLLPILTESNEEKAYKQYKNKRSYYNKQLKKLSGLLGTEVPLTSYVSRHTWATVARNMNIALPVISAGMGHTSESTTRIYLASLDASTIDNANLQILARLRPALR